MVSFFYFYVVGYQWLLSRRNVQCSASHFARVDNVLRILLRKDQLFSLFQILYVIFSCFCILWSSQQCIGITNPIPPSHSGWCLLVSSTLKLLKLESTFERDNILTSSMAEYHDVAVRVSPLGVLVFWWGGPPPILLPTCIGLIGDVVAAQSMSCPFWPRFFDEIGHSALSDVRHCDSLYLRRLIAPSDVSLREHWFFSHQICS